MIEGTLKAQRGPTGGTQVVCTFGMKTETKEGETTDGRKGTGQNEVI